MAEPRSLKHCNMKMCWFHNPFWGKKDSYKPRERADCALRQGPALVKEKAVDETHTTVWFCCSGGCEPALSTDLDAGSWCLWEAKETVLWAPIAVTVVHRVSQILVASKYNKKKNTQHKMYIKVIISHNGAFESQSKVHVTAVAKAKATQEGKKAHYINWNHKCNIKND